MSDESIQFTRNYSDLSTHTGFQFEFFCDRCGNGFRTKFRPFSMGMVSHALDTASSLFGGLLGQAADVSDRVSSTGRERAHDQKNCSRLLCSAPAVQVGCAAKAAGTSNAASVKSVLLILESRCQLLKLHVR